MPGPQSLQSDFSAGIRRSRARDDLGRSRGANVLWDSVDFIIGRLGVPLGARGPWIYQGTPLETTGSSTPSYVNAMSNDPFNGGNFMRAQDVNGKFWVAYGSEDFATWHKEMDYNSHSTEYNQNGASRQNGVFIGDSLQFPSADGTKLGSTHNEIYGLDWNMSGTAGGQVIYLATHLNRMVGLDVHENLWFGNPAVDFTAWDEDAKYYLGQPGTGLASLGPELLVFFEGHTKKVRGAIPAGYGVTADDIEIVGFAQDIGCIDAFSIVKWNTQIIWVDHTGVWATDGSNYPLDLAWNGGAQDLFRDFISNYVDRATTRVAAGIYNGMLFISMVDMSSNDHIDTLMLDLNRRTWARLGNFPFTCYVRGSLSTDETFAGVGHIAGHVAATSQILSPGAAVSVDGDGTPVQPVFETAYYRLAEQDSRIQEVWLGYEMDTEGAVEIQTIETEATMGAGTLEGVTLDWDATVPEVQTILDDELGDGLVVVSGVPGAWVVTWVAEGPQSSLTVTQGTLDEVITVTETQAGYAPPRLQVEFATDPRPNPTFGNYGGDDVFLDAEDIHGANDDGYHWKPVPVRAEAGGIAVKVTQIGPSKSTSIHSLGLEARPLPSYSQR